eukprot:10337755-Lingulodinium_polyedra.AAC.1
MQALLATALDLCLGPAHPTASCPQAALACTVQSLADIAKGPGLNAVLVLLSVRSPGSGRPHGGAPRQGSA